MKNLSTDPVDNPGENRRASCPEQAGTPFHGLLTNYEPPEEWVPASRWESMVFFGACLLSALVTVFVFWLIWR